MNTDTIITSAMILLAETNIPHKYLFGAYTNNGEAAGFLKLPEDHSMFVECMTGAQTIMGFKTLQATPADFPDGGRICVTHHPEKVGKGAIAVSGISEGIALAKERARSANQNRIFIIGGAEIIKQSIEQNLLDEIKLTIAYDHQNPVPNPIYLDFNLTQWNIKKDSGVLISKHSNPENLKYRFLTLGFKSN